MIKNFVVLLYLY